MSETLVSVSLKNTLTIVLMAAIGAGLFYGVVWLVRQAGTGNANG